MLNRRFAFSLGRQVTWRRKLDPSQLKQIVEELERLDSLGVEIRAGHWSNVLSWPGSKFVGEVLLSLSEIELMDQVVFAALALPELSD
jgi:hypothetical protein